MRYQFFEFEGTCCERSALWLDAHFMDFNTRSFRYCIIYNVSPFLYVLINCDQFATIGNRTMINESCWPRVPEELPVTFGHGRDFCDYHRVYSQRVLTFLGPSVMMMMSKLSDINHMKGRAIFGSFRYENSQSNIHSLWRVIWLGFCDGRRPTTRRMHMYQSLTANHSRALSWHRLTSNSSRLI